MANAPRTPPARPVPNPTVSKRRRVRIGALASLLAIGLGFAPPTHRAVGAQESTPPTPATAPLVVTADSIGATDFATAPSAAGDQVAETSRPGTTAPLGFRVETGNVAWLVLLVLLVVLIQLTLLRIRNRLRDRIHRTPTTSDPTLPARPLPAPADLETIVGEELRGVFGHPAFVFDESFDEVRSREVLTRFASTVANRTESRLTLTDLERATLHTTLITAVLDAFDLRPTTPDRLRSESVELRGGVVKDLLERRVVE